MEHTYIKIDHYLREDFTIIKEWEKNEEYITMSSQSFPNRSAEQHIQETPFQLQELLCHQDAGPQRA